jgi:hypothetical protein
MYRSDSLNCNRVIDACCRFNSLYCDHCRWGMPVWTRYRYQLFVLYFFVPFWNIFDKVSLDSEAHASLTALLAFCSLMLCSILRMFKCMTRLFFPFGYLNTLSSLNICSLHNKMINKCGAVCWMKIGRRKPKYSEKTRPSSLYTPQIHGKCPRNELGLPRWEAGD